MQKASRILFIVALVFSLVTTCALPQLEEKTYAQNITISQSSLTLYVGYYTDLEATIYPSTVTTSVRWESSNTYVATVSLYNSTGSSVQVVGRNPGTAVITASTRNGKKAQCFIRVRARNWNNSRVPLTK